MTEMIPDNKSPAIKIEALYGKNDESKERQEFEERNEKKSNALRSVMDGTFKGIIYDSDSLAIGFNVKGTNGSNAELALYPTSFKDTEGKSVSEIVVISKDSIGRDISQIAVGYVIQTLEDSPAVAFDTDTKFN